MHRLNVVGTLLLFALTVGSLAACEGGGVGRPMLTNPLPSPSQAARGIPQSPPALMPEAVPQDGRLSAVASRISGELGDDPNFGYVALEQGRLVILWHGPDIRGIERLRELLPEIEIAIRPAACAPGVVMDRVRALMPRDSRIRTAAISHDGDHVLMTVSRDAASEDLRREYEVLLGCPVLLEAGDVMPAPGN